MADFWGGICGQPFCKTPPHPLWALSDLIALVAPLGLFFGRLANFINGELYGRVTNAPIGMIFPQAAHCLAIRHSFMKRA